MKAIDIVERARVYAEHTDSYPTPREFDEAIEEIETLQSKIKLLEAQLEALKIFTHNPQTTVLRISIDSVETDILNKE